MDATEQLLRDAGLSDDQIKTTMEAFDPKALEALNKGTMRQSDYSRHMDGLKNKEQELEAKRQELLARWDTANTEYQRMLNDYEASERDKQEARAKLAEAEAKLADATKNAPDPAKVKEEVEGIIKTRLGEFAAGSTAYIGDVLDIVADHQQLFGSRLSPNRLMQDAAAAGKPPMDYWRETYKVDEKRKEVADKAEADRMEAARKEGYDKAVQDLSKPPGAGESQSSRNPFYETSSEGKNPWDDVGPTEAENQLLAELNRVGK